MDTSERELYYIRQKAIKDELSALYNAKEEGIKEGIKQGIEKGVKQGIEKGIKQGIEKGVRETSITIAKSLLDKFDDDTISEITKLEIDIIKNLRN